MSKVMNHIDNRWDSLTGWTDPLRPWLAPALIASVIVTILLMVIIGLSKSAWMLLGAGRGFIPEGYYHLWGFVLEFGTVFGQAVGWAGGSAIAFYALTLVGFRSNWNTARLAMSIVYIGLVLLPFSAYHILFGGPLLGMPREGLHEWLAQHYPDAPWLVFSGHLIIDYSLIPLALIFLGLLWKFGDRVQRSPLFQTALALTLLLTSLAVALSLGIHAILAHLRMGL
jgi:hypothetical protein